MPKHGIRFVSPWAVTGPPASVKGWVTKEGQRHDARMILEAANQGSSYDASEWIEEIDVPTAVVATVRDRALSLDAQLETARLIKATVFEFDDDHIASSNPEYPAVFVAACRDVSARIPNARVSRRYAQLQRRQCDVRSLADAGDRCRTLRQHFDFVGRTRWCR